MLFLPARILYVLRVKPKVEECPEPAFRPTRRRAAIVGRTGERVSSYVIAIIRAQAVA